MVSYASLAMTWILFLALFPMAFFWLRRAYRIFVKKDYSEVALKRGEAPANARRFAPFTGLTNLAAGGVAVWTIGGIVLGLLPYATWSATVGITLWMKICADYVISRQAHPFTLPKWLVRSQAS